MKTSGKGNAKGSGSSDQYCNGSNGYYNGYAPAPQTASVAVAVVPSAPVTEAE